MCDIDGVLRDFDTSWKDKWEKEFGTRPGPNGKWGQIADAGLEQGLSPEESYDLVFRTWGYEVMFNAQPYPGAIWGLKKLYIDFGVTFVALVSAQYTPETRKATTHWIRRWGLPYDGVVYTENKAAVKANVYIDDKSATVRELSERYPNARLFCPKRVWNENEEIPEQVEFVSGVEDVAEVLLW